MYFHDKTQTRSGKLQSHDDRDHDRAKVNASKEVTAPVNCVKCAKRLIQRGPREISSLVVYTTVNAERHTSGDIAFTQLISPQKRYKKKLRLQS